jgi:hypothetical protein
LGSHDSQLHFRPHKVYFFELSIKFYIKSSPKTLKLVNFNMERSQKFFWQLPEGICSRGQKYKKNSNWTNTFSDPKGEVSNLNFVLKSKVCTKDNVKNDFENQIFGVLRTGYGPKAVKRTK